MRQRSKKWLYLFLCVFICVSLEARSTWKTRLEKAEKGDFIVTAQGPNYSLLMIREKMGTRVVLEEITIAQNIVELDKVSWHKWVEKKAPGALSWLAMSIDLAEGKLEQCFSHLHNQWIFLNDADTFLPTLLALPLRPTRDSQRKKIGPSPKAGEVDRRKLWKPQLIREGKKQSKSNFNVIRMKWPNDKSRLAGCVFEMYVDANNPNFPFPFWTEVQSPHYTFKLRTVDSGRGVKSPMPLIGPKPKTVNSLQNTPSEILP